MGLFSSHPLAQTCLCLCLLSLPANASQIWEGNGRVISGVGQGGSVKLRLEIEGEQVRSLSGPPLAGKIFRNPRLNGAIQTPTGNWQIEECDKDLCVNLQQYHPKQIVFYRLQMQSDGKKIKKFSQ
jgi:hypothetical protein